MRPLREIGVVCSLDRSVDSGGTAAIVAPEIAVFSNCLREKRDIGGRVYRRIGRNGSDSVTSHKSDSDFHKVLRLAVASLSARQPSRPRIRPASVGRSSAKRRPEYETDDGSARKARDGRATSHLPARRRKDNSPTRTIHIPDIG